MPDTEDSELLKFMESWEGFHPAKQQKINPARITKTIELLNNTDGLTRRAHEHKMEEAVGTADFPYLFTYILDRKLEAEYAIPDDPLYSVFDYMKVGSVLDFNLVRREKVVSKSRMLTKVPPRGEYPPDKPTNCRYEYQVEKYGKRFDIDFEAVINDSLGAFSTIPSDMAVAARDTETYQATSLFVDSAGPNALLFSDSGITDCGQDVINQGALELSITNLEKTIALMKTQTDPSGKRMRIRPKYLVVPPELETTARGILTSAFKTYIPDSAAAATVALPTVNTLPQSGLQLRVNDWIGSIDDSGDDDTTWYLFADPKVPGGAAVEFGRMRGHEAPEIVMKASNKVRVSGGGPVSPMEGDFESDAISYRVRDIMGGTQVNPRMAYAQVG
jgi:hypothetical protein